MAFCTFPWSLGKTGLCSEWVVSGQWSMGKWAMGKAGRCLCLCLVDAAFGAATTAASSIRLAFLPSLSHASFFPIRGHLLRNKNKMSSPVTVP